MIQTIKDAMRQNNTDWHISSTSLMQQHQEHLILLFHARKCPHDEDTTCPVTPQCAEAKRMWKHIAECKDKKCGHCYSSRYVLTHYRECKDVMCQICGPVREEICLRKQQQQGKIPGLAVADTFSTTMTPSTSTPRLNNKNTALAVTPTTMVKNPNPMPTLTVAICRSANNVGRIIPVRMVRARSFSSLSTLSQGTSSALSSRSSVPSNHSNGSGRSKPYFVKDRENLGIAHFYNIKE